jgi:hypothetical protein
VITVKNSVIYVKHILTACSSIFLHITYSIYKPKTEVVLSSSKRDVGGADPEEDEHHLNVNRYP